MENIGKAMSVLELSRGGRETDQPVNFSRLLSLVVEKPEKILRNVFQVFHDMIKSYVGAGVDEYPDDSETVGFLHYDFTSLLVDQVDHPFFADRIFANRFVNLAEAMKSGAQQNKIYIFDGPPGCGKSTFLNNLLGRLEEYSNTEDGFRYEAVWMLDWDALRGSRAPKADMLLGRLADLIMDRRRGGGPDGERDEFKNQSQAAEKFIGEWSFPPTKQNFLEVGCPSHDHPLLIIPKDIRVQFFEELFKASDFRDKLFNLKEYEWILHDQPCTICSAMYDALLNKLGSPPKVMEMLYARPYKFNRRLGEGVSVFNPGDKPLRQTSLGNPMIQDRINELFGDSNQVQYLFSRFAKTNNGVYALMDIKAHNTDRMLELHNIISEGVHKVEYIEENVNSLFLAVMNPEDKANLRDFPSFSDRIQYIEVPYVLDYKTEVEIYRHIFGRRIDQKFLPRVLENFARVIVSTRVEERSPALQDWIKEPRKYQLYCDENLQLLKMDLYTGYIPRWLSEEDRKSFNVKRRRAVLEESKKEGKKGFSGRDSIKIFGDFYAKFVKDDVPVNMSMLTGYFTKPADDSKKISQSLLDSLVKMYDYLVLQEVKESLYYYNEEQIARDIQHYIFAVNFEPGVVEKCSFTGERLEITEEFLRNIENRILGSNPDQGARNRFRKDILREYTSHALTQEIMLEGLSLTQTKLFNSLRERYVHNLKQKVLDPFLSNENFRRGLTDFGKEEFKTYDTRIKEDITFLIGNLVSRFGYTARGAQSVCLYVIDRDLAKKFQVR
ncbi:MAG: serine protein kinase PrkA [Pseudomonadota bacterium]